MQNKDPQTEAQMAASGQYQADLQPRSQKRGITQSDPQLDWRERFYKKFVISPDHFKSGLQELNNNSLWTNYTQNPGMQELIAFIAEVEKLAEERGRKEKFGEVIKATNNLARTSLKTELVEKLQHSEAVKVEGEYTANELHLIKEGFNAGNNNAIEIIKSA